MKNKFDPDIRHSANGEAYLDACAESVQTLNAWRYVSERCSGLAAWLLAQLEAHNDRVSALGVYRRCRVDEPRPTTEKSIIVPHSGAN